MGLSATVGGAPDPMAEEPLCHGPRHPCCPLVRRGGLRAGPAAVDRVVEDAEPAVEQVGCERRTVVQVAVAFDHVDLVTGGVEQDMAPVVGNSSDVGLPIDEAWAEVEVRRQQIVLADVDVLT